MSFCLLFFDFDRNEAQRFKGCDEYSANDTREDRDASVVDHSDNSKETDSANDTADCLNCEDDVSQCFGVDIFEKGSEKVKYALLARVCQVSSSYSIGISRNKSFCICISIICVHNNLLFSFGIIMVKSSIFDILYVEK